MPALLEDPTSPVVYRTSGQGPFPSVANPQIPSSIFPRPVTLRDRVTIATLVPCFSPDAVPPGLLSYLSDNFNKEIEDGNTYPMMHPLPLDVFGHYWFGNFGAIMILGDIGGVEAINEMDRNGADWNKLCLGSFYVKPNYPGRSSHVCNGGFLVTPLARNKGVGKSMGQCYLDWAPQLGYTYSVFNLVYETNTVSTRIWDSLGFKRIGRVPGCGNLKSFSEPVDAIIYGRDLKSEEGNEANEERFDKIRYYLRHSSYPQGADRSEKSRLRSAATHYKLIPATDGVPEKLMLKDKEVISDPQAQYDIAKHLHFQVHGGINKTTAMIATKYHWVRIKETVSHVIKNCPECKDSNKPQIVREGTRVGRSKTLDGAAGPPEVPLTSPDLPAVASQTADPTESKTNHTHLSAETEPELVMDNAQTIPVPDQNLSRPMSQESHTDQLPEAMQAAHLSEEGFKPEDIAEHLSEQISDHLPDPMADHLPEHISADDYRAIQAQMNISHHDSDHLQHDGLASTDSDMLTYDDMAIDPQIMEQIQAQIAAEEHQAYLESAGMQQFTTDSPHMPAHAHQDIHPHPHSSANNGGHSHPHPQYTDTPHLQPHRSHVQHEPHDFNGSQPGPAEFGRQPVGPSHYISPPTHPHPMMGHPVPDDDHIMSGQGGPSDDTGGPGGAGGGGVGGVGVGGEGNRNNIPNNMQNNMQQQQMRHVLPMEYMNTHAQGHFQQQ